MDILDRFIKHVATDDNGCLIWVGSKTTDGYGALFIRRKQYRAHRISFQLFLGSIPEGLKVCHHCDNPICVHPDHLFLGTDADNIHDMYSKGRGQVGEKHHNAKLTEEDVKEMREKIASEELTQYKAAQIYGVDTGLVNGIVHRKYWKHI